MFSLPAPAFAIYPSLKDTSVFVTGGASGIGAEIVRAFAGRVLGWASSISMASVWEGGRVGVDCDGSAGTTSNCATCETSTPCGWPLTPSPPRLGPARVLVNNAARDNRHTLARRDARFYDERIATNLRHMFFAIQMVAPAMIAAGSGAIINLGSDSWWRAGGGFPVYTTAKAAVHGLTRGMARDLGRHRIRVNTLVPGWTMTERQKQLWVTPDALAHQLAAQCLPDPIEPVYVARMALFLAADDSAMCTANNYMVEAESSEFGDAASGKSPSSSHQNCWPLFGMSSLCDHIVIP